MTLADRSISLSLSGFTGIDQAYEEPDSPEIVIEAGAKQLDDCVQQVISLLQEKVGNRH